VNCVEVRSGDYIEKYLRGELSEEESQQLEEHYFSCDDCYETLRVLSAARTELVQDRWSVAEERAAAGQWHGWAWATAAAVILVVGLAIWLRPPEPLGLSDEALTAVAAVEPPPYAPRSLRSAEGEEENAFERAMVPYQEGDYREAADRLESLVQSQPQDAASHFYLGASYLLTDRREVAIESFGRVVELGESRYLGWARFYRAKAHLGQGDLKAARADLEAVVARGGELAAQAREILGQL
jgi:tetratricopeptide (TPR) repeat protein